MKKITIDTPIELDKQQIVSLLNESYKDQPVPRLWLDILIQIHTALENHIGFSEEETQ